jgi:hypothetical protein
MVVRAMAAEKCSIEGASNQEEPSPATTRSVDMEQAMDKKTYGCLKEDEFVTLKGQLKEVK